MTRCQYVQAKRKATIRRWTSALVVLFVLMLSHTPTVRADGNIHLVLANDFLATNELNDDLYTAALEVEYQKGRYNIFFGENTFTDSERDVRFDETYLSVERQWTSLGAWQLSGSIGAVHVGRGLLGQSIQNAVHRLIGDEEVDIAYVEESKLYPTLGMRVFRPLPTWRGVLFDFHASAYGALSFQGHTAAGVHAHWRKNRLVAFDLGVGARYSWTSYRALEPRLADLGPTWEAGVTLWNQISFSWDYNSFGTKSQHFNIRYNLKFKDRKTQIQGHRSRFEDRRPLGR